MTLDFMKFPKEELIEMLQEALSEKYDALGQAKIWKEECTKKRTCSSCGSVVL